MSKHKWYDVIVAWADGETIQAAYSNDDVPVWQDFISTDPRFDSKCWQWRVKPKVIRTKFRVAQMKDKSFVIVVNDSLNESIQYDSHFKRFLTDWIEFEEEVHE